MREVEFVAVAGIISRALAGNLYPHGNDREGVEW
jgi:hypothetical protein